MGENKNKLRVVKDYDKLDKDLKEQIKLVYPDGYSEHIIEFTNHKGEIVHALRFETDDKIYLVRMTIEKALQLIENDDDYDDDGILKEAMKEKYADKHAEIDYLKENDNYSLINYTYKYKTYLINLYNLLYKII